MARICITGSTDGIGLDAARRLLANGHRVVVHARSEDRGRAVVDGLEGDVVLVVGDLADLDQVRELAVAIDEVDVLVHNAGIGGGQGERARGESPQGLEPVFAVNALAPHLLTALLRDRIHDRLVFLGSGLAASGHVDPERLGAAGGSPYADSKALDVLLSLAWADRLPGVVTGAVDPGWVRTKLAGSGAPGDVGQGGERVAVAAADPDWPGGYTAGHRSIRIPSGLDDPDLQDRVLAAMDRLAGV